jgi:hypothetical protein
MLTGREKQTTADKLSPVVIPQQMEPEFNGLPPSIRSNNPVVQERIEKYLKMKSEDGFDLIESIRTHKDFGNPKVLSVFTVLSFKMFFLV